MLKVGKYEILGEIGRGGFGTVFKGRDTVLKRLVAIKTCDFEDEVLRRRFQQEAEIVASLQHPHITTVFDFGTHDDRPFLVQEFLSGEDLKEVIQREDPLPIETKLGYLAQVALALGHAHQNDIIHRDVKPGNVRVLEDGTVKVMDFGIAKLANLETRLTRTGMMVGTAAYLAPEVVNDESIDNRADIFSFGVLAYELLSYERPFQGSTVSALLYQLAHIEAPPLKDKLPDCPRPLAELVGRCLEKDPGRRPSSFGEVLEALDEISSDLGQAARRQPSGSSAAPAEAPVDHHTKTAPARGTLPTSVAMRRAAAHGKQQEPLSRSFVVAPRRAVLATIVLVVAVAAYLAYRSMSGEVAPTASPVQSPIQNPVGDAAESTAGSAEPRERLAENTSAAASSPSDAASRPSEPSEGESPPARAPSETPTPASAARDRGPASPEPEPRSTRRVAPAERSTQAASPSSARPSDQNGTADRSARGEATPPPPTTQSSSTRVQPPPASDLARAAPTGVARPMEPPPSRPATPAETQPVESDRDNPTAVGQPPAETAAPSVEEERAGVRKTLQMYERAYEALDAGALEAIWPGLDADQLDRIDRSFRGLSSLELDMSSCKIDVEGNRATAVCQVERVVKPRAGTSQSVTREERFELRKSNGSWLIVSS